MPRKKQDRPKHVTKWEDGAGGAEGKELCEEEVNTAIDNDSGTHTETQQSSASDTEDNSVEPNISSIDESNNSNHNNNANDNKDAQKIKCDANAVIRHDRLDCLTSSDSALTLRINAKTNDENYLISQSRLSESDITSTQKTSSPEPPTVQMETDDASAPLDFSIKPNKKATPKQTLNGPKSLSVKNTVTQINVKNDTPLDLSTGKRLFTHCSPTTASSKSPVLAKVPRFDSSSPWNYSAPRDSTPPKQSTSHTHNDMSNLWNGKLKNNLLSGKMSSPTSSPSSSTSPGRVSSGSHSGRQNPWQTQWINRSSEQTRDVFTCVWCKESFRSLAEMTDHMKKSPRCGMAGMQHAATSSTHNPNVPPTGAPPIPSSHQPSTSIPKEPISSSVLAKNNVGLPRKLVRGQDVWLGRGAEQTRQILKCMWCGQSFKTLADMTTHMRVTQHYTNIISQEQIISWRTPEDKLTQAQVNAVLTCKVCDEAFGSLKELSYHMVKNAHYKEHILRSITEGGHGRRRQTRERRKKSLPVRKLLELERREMTKDEKDEIDSLTSGANGQLITCDECHEKIDAKSFISHIKLCKAQVKLAMRSFAKSDKSPDRVKSPSSSGSRSGPPSRGTTVSPEVKVKTEVVESDCKTQSGSEAKDDLSENTNEANTNVNESPGSSFGSVLNAIERLIEKSFDPKSRKTQSTGILQRLGIDEEVCPPWQHMPQVPWARNGSDYFNDGRTSSRSSGHHSTSPLPPDLLKESNGSISSPDSSECCDDSNSCNSLTNNIGISLKSSGSAQTTSSPKLSFPISALIAEKSDEESDHKTKISSPRSETHSHYDNSNSPIPQSSYVSKFVNNETKFDKLSDISDDERVVLKSPKREPYASSPLALEIKTDLKRQTDNNCKREKSTSSAATTSSTTYNSNTNTYTTTSSSIQSTRSRSEVNEKAVSSESDTFHPLMQLQKLLDKTDSGNKNKAINSSNTISNNNSGVGVSTSLLAFSWACNDANTLTTSSTAITDEKHHKSEHLMKCAFCETHFVSKGAYRHHLSKMHFIKADKHCDLTNTNTNNNNTNNHNHNHNENPVKDGVGSGGTGNSTNSDTSITANESSHSKFLKYTELAKQLSSKYV